MLKSLQDLLCDFQPYFFLESIHIAWLLFQLIQGDMIHYAINPEEYNVFV